MGLKIFYSNLIVLIIFLTPLIIISFQLSKINKTLSTIAEKINRLSDKDEKKN
jgi:hypothetical protein